MTLSRYLIAAALLLSAIHCKNTGSYETPTIQIGVVVSDLNRSLEFYKNVLGMEETGIINLDADFGKESGLTGGVPTQVKVLRLEDSKLATEWKIMTFDSLPPVTRSTHIQDAVGMQYITLSVNSMAPFLERLRKNNVPLLGNSPVELQKGRYFVLFQDPDGIFIELIGNE